MPDAVTFAGGMDSTDKTDTIVFTVTSPAPVRLDPVYATDDATSVPMRVLQSARGINPAFFPDRIKIANQLYGDSNLLRSYFASHAQDSGSPVAPDGTIVLLPNTTYIATVDLSHSFLYANENYRAEDLSFTITQDSFHRITCNTSVLGNGQWSRGILERATEYLPIAPYSPGIWDTAQGDFFKTAAEGAGISAHSLMAVTTRDLMSILPFSSGDVYITQGRGLNQEDLAGKAKVCLVSEALAELNGYQLGDKLPMSFYKSEFIYSPYVSTLSPVFNQDSGGFFDEGTFEIVGFYGGNVTTAMDPDSSTQYKRDNGVFMTELFVPEGSAENTPPVRVCPFDTSIQLEPTQVQAFTADITAKGLTEKQEGGLTLDLQIYDRGLSKTIASIRELQKISRLTLGLSAAAALLAVILLSALYLWQSRRQIAGLRSLGVKKQQVLILMLGGLMLVYLAASVVGTAVGQGLAATVSRGVIASTEQAVSDSAFTAFLADSAFGEAALGVQAYVYPMMALVTVLALMLAFALILLPAVFKQSGKSPMLYLGAKE